MERKASLHHSTKAIVLCKPSEGIKDNTPGMNADVPETKNIPPSPDTLS